MPHADNLVPIGALALFAGAKLPKHWAFAVPLVALFLSDLAVGYLRPERAARSGIRPPALCLLCRLRPARPFAQARRRNADLDRHGVRRLDHVFPGDELRRLDRIQARGRRLRAFARRGLDLLRHGVAVLPQHVDRRNPGRGLCSDSTPWRPVGPSDASPSRSRSKWKRNASFEWRSKVARTCTLSWSAFGTPARP